MPVAAPGKPYTSSQWLSLPAGKRGFQSYQRYVNWWNTKVGPSLSNPDRKPAVATPPGGGYNPGFVTPAVVKGVPYPSLPSYFNPISNANLNAQATTNVNTKLNPLIAQVQKQYADLLARTGSQFDTATRQGQAGINASMQGWLDAVKGLPASINQTYNQQIAGQQGVNDAVQAFLQKSGQQTLGDLTSQAQAAGAPAETVAGFQGGASPLNVGGAITGGRTAEMGYGAGALTSLLAQQQADVAGAERQPGLIHSYGADALASFLQDQSTKRAAALSDITGQQESALGQITAQAPGLIQDVYQNLLDRETTKAQMRAQYGADRATYLQGIRNTNADYLQAARIFNAGAINDQMAAIAKATGTAASNLQFRQLANGDYGYFDKSNGSWYKIGNAAKPGSGGAGAGGPGGFKRTDKVFTDAVKLAQGFYTQFPSTKTTVNIGSKYAPKYVQKTVPGHPADNMTAYLGLISYYKGIFPNKDEAWIVDKAKNALIAGHYGQAKDDLANPAAAAAYFTSMSKKYAAKHQNVLAKKAAREAQALDPGHPVGPVGQTGQQKTTGITGPVGKQTPQQKPVMGTHRAGYGAAKTVGQQTQAAVTKGIKSAAKTAANPKTYAGVKPATTKAAKKVGGAIYGSIAGKQTDVARAQNASEKNALADIGERIKSGQWKPLPGAKPQDDAKMAAEIAQYLQSKYPLTPLRARQIASIAIFNSRK